MGALTMEKTDMGIDPGEVVDRMMTAVQNNDIELLRAVNADDVRVWHNYDGIWHDKEEVIALLSGLRAFANVAYRVLERICVADRVIQRHEINIKTLDGKHNLLLDAAVFMTIKNGQIKLVEEYADAGQVRKIGMTLQATGSGGVQSGGGAR